MGKKGVRIAELKVNNGSIVVYYSRQGIMRYPTGITIDKKKNKGKYLEWDYKNNNLNPSVNDYHARKDKLNFWLNKANDILEESHKDDITLTAKEFEDRLTNIKDEKDAVNKSLFLSVYNEFHKSKKEHIDNLGNPISIKDYTSFMNLIMDYEEVNHVQIKIKDVNLAFIKKLHIWMTKKRSDDFKPQTVGYKLKSKGGLNPKTIRKRFDTFKEFMKYLHEDKRLINGYDFLKSYVKSTVKNIDTIKVTLTVDELHKFYNYTFKDKKLEKVRDIFVFACFTGMRWTDLTLFKKEFIKSQDDGFVYTRIAQKTRNSSGKVIQVPLCAIAIEILEKYNYDLTGMMISNDKSNEYIKYAAKETGYFNNTIEKKDKETDEYLKRYEAISMHKARDTFISNLVNTTPLNELMQYTGHSKLSTLQQYIDKTRQVQTQYVKNTFDKK
jgi:site-specific recombinase XerD